MHHLTFREIQFGTADYRLACDLRDSILRFPLGLRLGAEDVAADSVQRHFGLFQDDGRIDACLVAAPQSDGMVKFRQMAVAVSSQGVGCGRKLIVEVESVLRGNGFLIATLHARMSAVGFYEKLGYRREGQEFIEVGIAHIQMRKEL